MIGSLAVFAVLAALLVAPCRGLAQQASDAAPASGPASEPAVGKVPEEAPQSTGPRPGFPVRVSQILNLKDMHRWDRHVRGFRREHNFAAVAGVSTGTWSAKWPEDETSGEYDNNGIVSRFQYSFHLQIYKGFGYVLGSSAGYHYETADRRREFRPVPAWQFPGLLAGLTINVSPVLRLSAAFDAYLERHNGLVRRLKPGESSEIYVTMQAYDAGVYADVFYDLSWAVRLEAHVRHLESLRPRPGSETFPVEARLHKDDRWVGVGLLYHLL